MIKKATKQELLRQGETLTQAWEFLKSWYHIPADDGEWNNMLKAANELNQSLGNTPFSKAVILDVIREIEQHLSEKGESHG